MSDLQKFNGLGYADGEMEQLPFDIEFRGGSYFFPKDSQLVIPGTRAANKLQCGYIHGELLQAFPYTFADALLQGKVIVPSAIINYFIGQGYNKISETVKVDNELAISSFLMSDDYQGLKVLSVAKLNSILAQKHTHLTKTQLHNAIIAGQFKPQLNSQLYFWYYLARFAIRMLHTNNFVNKYAQPTNRTNYHFKVRDPFKKKAVYTTHRIRPNKMHYEYMDQFRQVLYNEFKINKVMSTKALNNFFSKTGFDSIKNSPKIEAALTLTQYLINQNYIGLNAFSIKMFNNLSNQQPTNLSITQLKTDLIAAKPNKQISSTAILWFYLAQWSLSKIKEAKLP